MGNGMARTLRVLLVEDSPDDAALIVRELRRAGYDIAATQVDSPLRLSAMLDERVYDLVLADWHLPKLPVPTILEILKRRHLDLPFIVVSGAISKETAIAAMKIGAHDVVMKNDLVELPSVIERELLNAEERRARRQAEQNLAASEERFRLASLATNDAIRDWNLTTDDLWWNAGLETLFGLTTDSIEPGIDSWYSRLHPEDQKRVIASCYAAINGGNVGWSDEYRFLRADGTYAHVLDRSFIVRNSEGQAVRLIGAMTDLTFRKQAEEKIAAAYDRLRTVTLELDRVKEQESKHIARELHDEFGQILTGLKLDLAWLNRQLTHRTGGHDTAPLTEKIRSMVSAVDTAIQSVRRIARSLRPCVLDDLGLQPALEWLAHEFQSRSGVPCEVIMRSSAAISRIDPDRATAIFRITQELLTNVARHAQATTVRILYREEKDGVLLEVEDNGRGISVDRSAAHATLGLRGIRERVELFGGMLRIHGERGVGTAVTAYLPLEKDHADQQHNKVA
jgi:two-component system sensor histidine kinase UhpB